MFFKKVFVDNNSAWKLQNREQEENPIYKYINLQRQGRMVDIYKKSGVEGLEQLVRDELPSFMYRCGRGGWISMMDHSMWNDMISLKMQSVTNKKNNTSPVLHRGTYGKERSKVDQKGTQRGDDFVEHEACWQLKKRGSVGESIIHLAMLFSDHHVFREITKVLLNVFPKLALDIYEGEEYYGESGLHIAIVYKDLELTKLFVSKGANINQRATGRFFLPEDQKNGRLGEQTNYNGFAYYGEYPLAFAACFGQEEIYEYLIEQGADPNLQDSFGNTVVHMMVISNQMSMLSVAVKHNRRKANIEIMNNQSLTPLTLASKLGRMQIFNEIIKLQSQEIWRYSNITCSVYPLAPLDTIGENGKTNINAALIYITRGNTDSHLEMLDDGIIKQLLAEKWKNYVKKRFLERLLLAITFLLTLSIAIYTRPDEVFCCSSSTSPLNTTTIVRYVAECFVVLYCLVTIIFLMLEIHSEGLLSFLKQQLGAPAKSFFNISCLLIMACVPLRFCNCCTAEKILLSIAAPCAWANLLFFSRPENAMNIWVPFLPDRMFYFSGVFVVVFYQMLRLDLMRFGIIYAIFFIGFGQTFYFLFKTASEDPEGLFGSLGGTAMKLFEMTLGDYQYESFSTTAIPVLTKFVFVSFAILVPILLLNMLIATFVHTYEQIIKRSEKEWKRQWAKIIIVLERTFTPAQLVRFQENYSVEFGNDSSKSRGLMVIKTSARSISRQRKEARANWKRMFNIVKKLSSSEDMNHKGPFESKTTKVKEAASVQPANDDFGILAVAKQLAWEKDIDLSGVSLPLASDTDSKTTLKDEKGNSKRASPRFLFPQSKIHPSESDVNFRFYTPNGKDALKESNKTREWKMSACSPHEMASTSSGSICSLHSNSSATPIVRQKSKIPIRRY